MLTFNFNCEWPTLNSLFWKSKMTSTNPRKSPRQERSKATVAAIVEAAAQLLVEDGFHKMSTNKIAKRAGVSIGSLYQYFSNKEAVVAAVIDNFAEEQMQVLARGLEGAEELSLLDAVKAAIRALIETKRSNPDLNRVLFQELPPIGQLNVYNDWSDSAVALVHMTLELNRAQRELKPVDLELAAFVVVHACHGIIQAMVGQRSSLLNDERAVDEIATLVAGYLGS